MDSIGLLEGQGPLATLTSLAFSDAMQHGPGLLNGNHFDISITPVFTQNEEENHRLGERQ